MEVTNALSGSGGVTVVGSDVPSDYHVASRTANENPPRLAGSESLAVTLSTPPQAAGVGSGGAALMKKKRGRPRKYGSDGSAGKALSPRPISSSAPPPPVIDFSAAGKRGKIRPVILTAKPRMETVGGGLGDWFPTSGGASFTPHIITVNAGEDVMKKVISFSQQGPRAICILSANGIVSSATIRQPDSSGGTLTYEGRFEILSLSGSFTPTETGGMRNRSGGMSVSLASADGRVVGGGVAGLLVAATPVQIVVGSFLSGNQQQQPEPLRMKKHKTTEAVTMIPAASIPIPIQAMDDEAHCASSGFRSGDGWPTMTSDNSAIAPPKPKVKPATDINMSLAG
ncbi:AT-hook motif nuclear-localized protein 1-like isoform X2 [Andrographis paniculata]|uniref:AT-hook motif nuclear-localized protein 1-like isoform X2 n=1 Tax=Andrographis paniculata TaxID=175694 RepID=UPI0021E8A1B4|nr:AT-hook motif nuclear-localized protein 1-like isoform X2 [Andrographis paniculata]